MSSSSNEERLALNLDYNKEDVHLLRKVLRINRPADLKKIRFDIPVFDSVEKVSVYLGK
jgi:hypothetical protein